MPRPNVLFLMTDQQRFDTVRALGNAHIHTPNLDRLVARGVTFRNAYSTCPVCVAARYTVRTGREPHTTRVFSNAFSDPVAGQPAGMEERCGEFLARRMRRLGYRTFGIGKFHTRPWDQDLGFDAHLHSEELYGSPDQRARDAYAAWIARERPHLDYIEALMGERTEMYYMPQVSPMPAEDTVESWAADRAIEQIRRCGSDPWFGFVSFIGPHPPFAPPLPFNRMYNPDRMPNPVRGDRDTDHMDAFLPYMNHAIWAEDINDSHARVLKARYYGEITFIDACIGRILDALDASGRAEDTLIAFFADHGDHLGDHHAWQKESFFDAACRIPFLLSWPERLPTGAQRTEFACLTDLFGVATGAAGEADLRDGCDLLGVAEGRAPARPHAVGMYGEPGTACFKIMIRDARWKYIFIANGGREQLFDLAADPEELRNRAGDETGERRRLRRLAVEACRVPGAAAALDGDDLRSFPFAEMPRKRIHQFDASRGVRGFPVRPEDVAGGRPGRAG